MRKRRLVKQKEKEETETVTETVAGSTNQLHAFLLLAFVFDGLRLSIWISIHLLLSLLHGMMGRPQMKRVKVKVCHCFDESDVDRLEARAALMVVAVFACALLAQRRSDPHDHYHDEAHASLQKWQLRIVLIFVCLTCLLLFVLLLFVVCVVVCFFFVGLDSLVWCKRASERTNKLVISIKSMMNQHTHRHTDTDRHRQTHHLQFINSITYQSKCAITIAMKPHQIDLSSSRFHVCT